MRALVTAPPGGLTGGVSNYYAVLRRHLPPSIEYCNIGARPEEAGPVESVRRAIGDFRAVRAALRSSPVDLLVVNPSLGWKALIRDAFSVALGKAAKKKVVVFFRGWDTGVEDRIRRSFVWLFRAAYRRADAFIVLSQTFERFLRDMGFTAKIFVETTVVREEVFAETESLAGLTADGPDHGRRILFLSRMEKGKGVELTLQAFRILSRSIPGVRLTMAGDGSLLRASREQAENHGLTNVEFPGLLQGERLRDAFRTASVFCLLTDNEGMPNSVLEAMAYGLPVVTRPVGGLQDFFEDGRMGYMTKSRNPEEIAALLENLLRDEPLRKEMGCHNRAFAFQRFRASEVARRFQRILEEVIANAGEPCGSTC